MALIRNFTKIGNVPIATRTILSIDGIQILTSYKKLFSTTSSKCKKKVDVGSLGSSDRWFYQKHKNVPYDEPVLDKTNMEIIMQGFKILPAQLNKYGKEWKEDLKVDDPLFEDGDLLKLFDFNKEETINDWTFTADSTNDAGFSKGTFVNSSSKTCLFSGYIDRRLPKDGLTKRAGFCNITSNPRMKAFFQPDPYRECDQFTHVVFRCRGDGRSYMILLDVSENLDITWGSKYFYLLYTRGGPHWQTTFIPFPHFIRLSRGYIQDSQYPIIPGNIKYFGLTAANIEGHFRLEMDYIGVYKHTEHSTFPYEFYNYTNMD